MTTLATVTPLRSVPAAARLERSTLHQSLRAVAMFQCDDATREHLQGVRVELRHARLTFVATDGHTLAMATHEVGYDDVDASAFVRAGDVKALLAALKPSRATADDECAITIDDDYIQISAGSGTWKFAKDGDHLFPPYREVIPPKAAAEADAATNFVGLSALYLERVAKAAIAFAGGRNALGARGVAMQVGADELGPVRFDWDHPDIGELVVVVMPMRIR